MYRVGLKTACYNMQGACTPLHYSYSTDQAVEDLIIPQGQSQACNHVIPPRACTCMCMYCVMKRLRVPVEPSIVLLANTTNSHEQLHISVIKAWTNI